MIGRQEVHEALFYRFRIEDHVPADHLLRRIDWLLDFNAIRHEFEALYSHTGRPSVDPELMIRMLLIGYLYGIRSERRLVDEVHPVSYTHLSLRPPSNHFVWLHSHCVSSLADMAIEPRLDIIGAALADPSRSRILCELMDGRAFTNKELACAADVSPQTASAHLKQLEMAGLTSSLRSGRHVYHRIAGADVAQVLEGLASLCLLYTSRCV